MTPLNFTIIGLRLLGIYLVTASAQLFSTGILIATYITQLTSVASHFKGQEAGLFFSFLPGVSQVLVGILLFIFSIPLARRIVPPVSDESVKVAWSLEDVQAIAFGVVGIVVLSAAFPLVGRAWQNLEYWCNYQQQSGVSPYQSQGYLISAIGVFAQIILGLLLLLNPRGFRNAWHWMRTAGTKPSIN